MREPDEVLDAIRAAATSGEVGEVVARARARAVSAFDVAGGDLDRLLAQLGDVERAAQERRDRQHQAVLDVLRELGEHGTGRGLIDGTTEALRRLGFELSSIEWLGDERGTEGESAAAGPEECPARYDPIRRNVVRRRSAVLVPRCAGPGGPSTPSTAAAEVAAPVIVGSGVAAVLRAGTDHRLDETDRQIVATFADGLGHLIRCHGLSEELAALKVALTDVIDRATFPGPTAWLAAPPQREDTVAPATDRSAGGPLSSLTPRESETLRHLAAGETNARIARRLVISEGTVKSHVKNLLRKLDAANRAEAVSIWHRASTASDPRGSRYAGRPR